MGRRSVIVMNIFLVKSIEAVSHFSVRQISGPTNTRAPARATRRRKTSYGLIRAHLSMTC